MFYYIAFIVPSFTTINTGDQAEKIFQEIEETYKVSYISVAIVFIAWRTSSFNPVLVFPRCYQLCYYLILIDYSNYLNGVQLIMKNKCTSGQIPVYRPVASVYTRFIGPVYISILVCIRGIVNVTWRLFNLLNVCFIFWYAIILIIVLSFRWRQYYRFEHKNN